MKKRKTQKPKPVKAWAVVAVDDGYIHDVYLTRESARFSRTLYDQPDLVTVKRVTVTVED